MNPPDAQAATVHDTVIAPPDRFSAFKLGELWEHRELIYFLTKRELQVRYKQSVFGISWAVLQPLSLAFIFALFFGKLVHIPSDEIPYPVFVVAGLVPWLFIAQAVTNSATGLVSDANLISKVYFPRLAIPVSKALSLVVDLGIAVVVLLVVMAVYDVGVSSNAYLVPLFLILCIVTSFAVGSLFAAANVKYRDIALVVPMLMQVMLFITPVVYPASLVSDKWGHWVYVFAINPMVTVIGGLRWSLCGGPQPETATMVISVASALLLLIGALVYFRRSEPFFADYI
jgi:lipopolysaccharide transport system permease protein